MDLTGKVPKSTVKGSVRSTIEEEAGRFEKRGGRVSVIAWRAFTKEKGERKVKVAMTFSDEFDYVHIISSSPISVFS